MDVDKIIKETVDQTVLKLKMANLIKDGGKTAFQKTEEILKNYTAFKASDGSISNKLIEKLDKAFQDISDDPYFSIVEMVYFQDKTREEIAEIYGTTVSTVSRNKTRLVNKIKNYLFSDDVIHELFL